MPRHLIGCPDSNKEGLVIDRSPQAVLTLTRLGSAGDKINIDGSASFARQGTLRKWRVDPGDGSIPIPGTGFPPASLPYTYATAGGQVIVTLYVEDNKGRTSTVSQAIEIATPVPVPPTPPTVNLSVNGGATTDNEWSFAWTTTGEIATAVVDFGDGTILNYTGVTLPSLLLHTYAVAAPYSVTLSVTAVNGLLASASVAIVVAPPPPPPDPDPQPDDVPPTAALAYVSGQFTTQSIIWSTAGTLEGNNAIVSYSIDYGDGTPVVPIAGPPPTTLTHIYAAAATYTLVLTVTDAVGLVGTATIQTTIQAVVVPNQPPMVTLTLVAGHYAGSTFTLGMTATDANGTIVSSRFNWGDGTGDIVYNGPPPATVSKVFATPNTFTARLTAIDNAGDATLRTLTFVIVAIPPDPDPGGARNDYYNGLITNPFFHSGYSLRSQAQLNSLVGSAPSTYFQYVRGADPYPTPKDGAKYFKAPSLSGTESIPGSQQLKMPLGFTSGQTVIIFDWWPGPEFRTNIGTVNNYKHWMIRDSTGSVTSGGIYDETRSRFSLRGANPEIATIDTRVYPGGGDIPPPNGGWLDDLPYEPTGLGAQPVSTYPVMHSVWGRYFLEVIQNQPAAAFTEFMASTGQTLTGGPYNMLSCWFADETRGPVAIMYKVPWKIRGAALSYFAFHFNTSTNAPAQAGNLIGYGSNVVILRNIGDFSALRARPVA